MRALRLGQAVLLLAAMAVGACGWPHAAAPPKRVQPFLIFYGGFPIQGDAARAQRVAKEFAGYGTVVFGGATAFPAFAAAVQRDLPRTRFYGYADTRSVTLRHVLRRLLEIRNMRFQGVLLDEVGYGLSSDPKALQAIVDAAHRDRLRVILNAWDPASLLPLRRLAPGRDGVLCENWVFSEGTWRAPRRRATYAALRVLQARGVLVYMGVTAAQAPASTGAMRLAVRETVLWEFGNYVGVSGPNYSAQTNAVFPAARLQDILRGDSF